MRCFPILLILTLGGCVLYVAPSFHLKGSTVKRIIKKRKNGSRRVCFVTDPDSVVEKHHKNEVDINSIMKKYRITGFLESNASEGQYGDFTDATDFHTMKNRIIEAESDFARLPAHLRTRFNNDPGQLLSFLDDPQNLSEAQELGLCPKPIPDTPPASTPPTEAPGPLVAAPGPDSAKPE